MNPLGCLVKIYTRISYYFQVNWTASIPKLCLPLSQDDEQLITYQARSEYLPYLYI